MSLLAWYPLISDGNNQGIENINLTTMGTVPYTAGKLGSAATFTNNAENCLHRGYFADMKDNFSWACWFKCTAFNDSYQFILSQGRDYLHADYGFNIIIHTNNLYLYYGDVTNGNIICYVMSLSTGVWYHVVAVTNSSEGIIVYVNGEVKAKKDYVEPNYSQSSNRFVIGKMSCNYTSSTQYFPFNGQICDVRIYDHALSAREVKEISKGLLLHYPLCQLDKPMCNIALSTNQGITGWGWSMQVGDKTITEVIEDGVRCCKMTRGTIEMSGWSYIGYSSIQPSIYKPGEKYTVSFEIKPSVTTSVGFLFMQSNALNPLTGWSSTSTIKANEWNKLYYTFTIVNPLPSDIGKQILYIARMDSSVGVSYMFRNLKIEEGVQHTQWCPAFEDSGSWFNGIEYDCSGFGNNGLVASATAPSWSTDTPKYNGCYSFNKFNNYIVANADIFRNVFNSGVFTVSMWITPNELNSSDNNCIVVCRTKTLSDHESKQFVISIRNNCLLISYYSDDHSIPYNFNNMNTYHLVCASNGLDVVCYINGEKIANITKKSVPMIPENAQLCIGQDVTRSYCQYYGLISDFRIYSTALSDEDVKALYDVRYSLSNNGVFMVGELNEDSAISASGLLKNGLATANEINEIENSNLNISSNSISAKEFIEI